MLHPKETQGWAVISLPTGDIRVVGAVDPYDALVRLIGAPEGAIRIGPLYSSRQAADREAATLRRVAGRTYSYSPDAPPEQRRWGLT